MNLYCPICGWNELLLHDKDVTSHEETDTITTIQELKTTISHQSNIINKQLSLISYRSRIIDAYEKLLKANGIPIPSPDELFDEEDPQKWRDLHEDMHEEHSTTSDLAAVLNPVSDDIERSMLCSSDDCRISDEETISSHGETVTFPERIKPESCITLTTFDNSYSPKQEFDPEYDDKDSEYNDSYSDDTEYNHDPNQDTVTIPDSVRDTIEYHAYYSSSTEDFSDEEPETFPTTIKLESEYDNSCADDKESLYDNIRLPKELRNFIPKSNNSVDDITNHADLGMTVRDFTTDKPSSLRASLPEIIEERSYYEDKTISKPNLIRKGIISPVTTLFPERIKPESCITLTTFDNSYSSKQESNLGHDNSCVDGTESQLDNIRLPEKLRNFMFESNNSVDDIIDLGMAVRDFTTDKPSSLRASLPEIIEERSYYERKTFQFDTISGSNLTRKDIISSATTTVDINIKNPRTGRNIKLNGDTYKKLIKDGCELIKDEDGNVFLVDHKPPPEKEDPNHISNAHKQYIYFLRIHPGVYKIGKSKDLDNRLTTHKGKATDFHLYFALAVDDCDEVERIILSRFKRVFRIVQGREYFSGDVCKMQRMILNIQIETLDKVCRDRRCLCGCYY